jgi:HPt (histidine-containing phosphotransfer) domain-containing protein
MRSEQIGDGSGSFDAGSKLTRAIVIDGLTLDGQRLVELEQLGKGETFLADLVANFNQESRQILQHMEQSVEQTDVRRFRDLGHTIKDSAGSLGIFELYQLGVRATRLYSSDFPDSAMRLLKDLRQCCDDSHRALRHYLSSRGKFFGLHE